MDHNVVSEAVLNAAFMIDIARWLDIWGGEDLFNHLIGRLARIYPKTHFIAKRKTEERHPNSQYAKGDPFFKAKRFPGYNHDRCVLAENNVEIQFFNVCLALKKTHTWKAFSH